MGFTTQRLEVRHLTIRDLEGFHEIWGDPSVIFWGAAPDLASTRARLEDFRHRRLEGVAESGWFAVALRDEGRVVGDVVLQSAPWDSEMAEIGWHFAKASQGRGYATEATAGLLVHAKQQGVDAVYAKILPDNAASQGVARRIGMHVVGRLDDPLGPHDLWEKSLDDRF